METFSKVIVSDDVKELLEEQVTANKFMYVIEPTYEELAKILTQKGVGERHDMNK